MHILANFVILMILDHFNRKMDILDLFLRTSNSLLSKSHDIAALTHGTLSRPVKTLLFWPIWPFWTPLRVLREAAARPCTSCLLAGGPFEPPNPCLGPQILVILTTFPIEKVNFVILPIRVSENHFDPILSPPFCPNLWSWPKCYLGPLPGWTLRDPQEP